MSLKTEAVILPKPGPADDVPEVKLEMGPLPAEQAYAPPSRRASTSAPAVLDHDSDDSSDDEDAGWETNSLMEQFIDDVSPPEYSFRCFLFARDKMLQC